MDGLAAAAGSGELPLDRVEPDEADLVLFDRHWSERHVARGDQLPGAVAGSELQVELLVEPDRFREGRRQSGPGYMERQVGLSGRTQVFSAQEEDGFSFQFRGSGGTERQKSPE